ncbi:CPBP family intramembrane glutamic endopeptidase [Peijinzhouia sedimentorum]
MNMEPISKPAYPNLNQSFGIVGIIILLMVGLSPIAFMENIIGKDAANFLYYVAIMGLSFWIIHKKRFNKIGVSKFQFAKFSPKVLILLIVAVIALQVGVSSPIINLIPMPDFAKEMFRELSGQKGIFPFLMIVIAAPVLEELIFRGIILDGLLKRYSLFISILASSLLFGIVHLNPWQFVSAMVIGFLAGWVYYKTKNLALPMLIHFANNGFAFGSMFFLDTDKMMDQSLAEQYGGMTNFYLITGGAILLSVGAILLLKAIFQKDAKKEKVFVSIGLERDIVSRDEFDGAE